jgi:hypothetical protein
MSVEKVRAVEEVEACFEFRVAGRDGHLEAAGHWLRFKRVARTKSRARSKSRATPKSKAADRSVRSTLAKLAIYIFP